MERIKELFERLQKGLLYFRKGDSYFRRSSSNPLDGIELQCADYPIDFGYLIGGIHFRNFDDKGVPIQMIDGDWIYSNSMILAYGIGCIQMYLRTGEKKWIEIAEVQANYIYSNSTDGNNGIVLREYESSTGQHTGDCSAMNQGKAASFFLRMYQLSNDTKWLNRAERSFGNFQIQWDEEDGVGFDLPSGGLWLEEYPMIPLKHTLNGALFGVIGLSEVSDHIPSLSGLRDRVMLGLEEMLPRFDRSFWSNYHFKEENGAIYIASMKYHSLHILQLDIISEKTGSEICKSFQEKFVKYQANSISRLRAISQMTMDKIFKRYL